MKLILSFDFEALFETDANLLRFAMILNFIDKLISNSKEIKKYDNLIVI